MFVFQKKYNLDIDSVSNSSGDINNSWMGQGQGQELLLGQITEVDGVLVTPSRLVEHGTQHDTIGSISSTSVSSSSPTGVTRTPSTSVIFFQLPYIVLALGIVKK